MEDEVRCYSLDSYRNIGTFNKSATARAYSGYSTVMLAVSITILLITSGLTALFILTSTSETGILSKTWIQVGAGISATVAMLALAAAIYYGVTSTKKQAKVKSGQQLKTWSELPFGEYKRLRSEAAAATTQRRETKPLPQTPKKPLPVPRKQLLAEQPSPIERQSQQPTPYASMPPQQQPQQEQYTNIPIYGVPRKAQEESGLYHSEEHRQALENLGIQL